MGERMGISVGQRMGERLGELRVGKRVGLGLGIGLGVKRRRLTPQGDDNRDGDGAPPPGLPERAKAFLVATGLAAAGVAAPTIVLARGDGGWATFAILVATASATQLFAFHTIRNQVFHTTPLLFVAGALLLPPQLLVLLPLLSHIPDWIRKRYAWYIQTFNILNFTLALMCAFAAARLV